MFGRGVGNSGAAYWNQCPDSDAVVRKRIAAAMVSAPHHDPDTFELLTDPLADMLARDGARLASDYAAGRVLRRPAYLRPDDDQDRILAAQGITVGELAALRERHAAEWKNLIP